MDAHEVTVRGQAYVAFQTLGADFEGLHVCRQRVFSGVVAVAPMGHDLRAGAGELHEVEIRGNQPPLASTTAGWQFLKHDLRVVPGHDLCSPLVGEEGQVGAVAALQHLDTADAGQGTGPFGVGTAR